MTTGCRPSGARMAGAGLRRRKRRALLAVAAALLALPWASMAVWWEGWVPWLLLGPLMLAWSWLLERLMDPSRLEVLEGRVTALEEREAVLRVARPGGSVDPNL